MKQKLLTGEEKTLKVPTIQKRQVFPKEVTAIAIKHWEQITTTEPAKHRYTTKAVKDGEETVPTRYQTATNEECHESFKETCSKEVGKIMESHAASKLKALAKRPDSEDKEYRMKHAKEVLPKKFPKQKWFMEARPAEVRMMHDHTTGLCKVTV